MTTATSDVVNLFDVDKQRVIRTAFFNIVPIRNQQVTVPTTIRMLRIIREDAKKHLSAKLAHTSFVLGGGGQIGEFSSTQYYTPIKWHSVAFLERRLPVGQGAMNSAQAAVAVASLHHPSERPHCSKVAAVPSSSLRSALPARPLVSER